MPTAVSYDEYKRTFKKKCGLLFLFSLDIPMFIFCTQERGVKLIECIENDDKGQATKLLEAGADLGVVKVSAGPVTLYNTIPRLFLDKGKTLLMTSERKHF